MNYHGEVVVGDTDREDSSRFASNWHRTTQKIRFLSQ